MDETLRLYKQINNLERIIVSLQETTKNSEDLSKELAKENKVLEKQVLEVNNENRCLRAALSSAHDVIFCGGR